MTKEEYTYLLSKMQQEVDNHPDRADAWRDLAQAKMMGGDFAGAENDCIECLRLDPKNVNGLILMGNLFANCKNDDESAIKFYERAVEADPNSPDALCNLGTLLFKRGDKLQSVFKFRKAIEKKPDHPLAYYMLAQCYSAMEDWRSAWLIATDAFEKCRIGIENEALKDRVSAGLSRVRMEAEAHGGSQPPQNGQKALEQTLRQRDFEVRHEGQNDPSVTMMMAMYMLGALQKFSAMPVEEVKKIAVEIAMLGTQGISPDKSSGYKVKLLPDEDFSGYRLLAYYYVSWAIALPDKLSLVSLPFDEAYKVAKGMLGKKEV